MANNTDKQINALTSTRAIAAITVVIHHFGSETFPFKQGGRLFNSGNVAISYFFVLSGFVLYVTYCNRDVDYRQYLKKRFVRIVPLYMLALLISVCIYVFWYREHISNPDFYYELAANAFMVQAFIPPYAMTINTAAWTLSVEMFFYLLFPFLLLLQKRKLWIFVALTVVLFVLSQAIEFRYYPQRDSLDPWVWNNMLFHPFMHFSQFLIGMVGGWLYVGDKVQWMKRRFLPLGMFVMILFLIGFRPDDVSYQVGLIAPLFMLLVLSIALMRPAILNNKALVYLGEISYGIYILQYPVRRFLVEINASYIHIPREYFFYLILVVLVLFASITHHFIELPLAKSKRR